jgi:DNA mismatch repair protein MutS
MYTEITNTMAHKATPSQKTSPLMQQYNGIKARYPDALLLFRVGDFYETFGQDAIKAAGILGIVLTKRNNGSDQTELAGFPHHSLQTYLPKLVQAGLRVAICDQLEDPKTTKTIVKRGVTELITPGVALNDDLQQPKNQRFLAAVVPDKTQWGLSFLDISTGEFLLAQGSSQAMEQLLHRLKPAEVLIPKQQKRGLMDQLGHAFHYFAMDDWAFYPEGAREKLTQHFKTASLKGFGVEDAPVGITAAGVILHYIDQTQHHKINHINQLKRLSTTNHLWMDRFTLENLEVLAPKTAQGVALYEVLDHTVSAMGGRMLRRWLAFPLVDIPAIEARHEVVDALVNDGALLHNLREQLRQLPDLERLASKTATQKIGPRELRALGEALGQIPSIESSWTHTKIAQFMKGLDALVALNELSQLLLTQLSDQAPTFLGKGPAIASGVDPQLDELRGLATNAKEYLQKMAEREAARTGITSLKITANNVFGYYIEVRNTHKDRVPEDWIRKQTLVNAERYITEELKEFEAKIFGAEAQIDQLEQMHFARLVQESIQYIPQIQQNAAALARLDCLCSAAHAAIQHHYCKPQLNESHELNIELGRHPVIEQYLPPDQPYIANDVFLDRDTQQMMMITGPNMSGKSALLRQTALISIMAQIGYFIPAQKAVLGILDKIFTRVGASDNIALGESTFMVEMHEAASIVNNLSERSLVLLDEIGRGTSTYDGISIAWAIAQFLHEHPTRAKTLFATHYHELNEMENQYPRIKNFHVSVEERVDQVLFRRKLNPGGSAHSFGIHVAKMAGMPQAVIHTAQERLRLLEQNHGNTKPQPAGPVSKSKKSTEDEPAMQLSFFQLDDPTLLAIKEQLIDTDIDRLTPLEALNKLSSIKKMLQGGQ